MKRTDERQLNQTLYDTFHRASERAAVPSFDVLAARIAENGSVESCERFFEVTERQGFLSNRRTRIGALGGAVAALLLLLVSVRFVLLQQTRYDNYAAAEMSMSLDTTNDTEMWAEDSCEAKLDGLLTNEALERNDETGGTAVYDDAEDCTQILLSEGQKLLLPMEALLNESEIDS